MLRTIEEIAPRPSVELRGLAKKALSQRPELEPVPAFSSLHRPDFDDVRQRTAG